MKRFGLRCPECKRYYVVRASQVAEWWDEHVGNCTSRSALEEAAHIIEDGAFHAMDRIRMFGRGMFQVFDQEGQLDGVGVGPNMIVNLGRAWILDKLQDSTNSVAVDNYGGVGTSSTAAAASQTNLITPVAPYSPRNSGTYSQPDAYTDRLIVNYSTSDAIGTITEIGRFYASSGAYMVSRIVITGVVKDSSHTGLQTHDLTYAAS